MLHLWWKCTKYLRSDFFAEIFLNVFIPADIETNNQSIASITKITKIERQQNSRIKHFLHGTWHMLMLAKNQWDIQRGTDITHISWHSTANETQFYISPKQNNQMKKDRQNVLVSLLDYLTAAESVWQFHIIHFVQIVTNELLVICFWYFVVSIILCTRGKYTRSALQSKNISQRPPIV